MNRGIAEPTAKESAVNRPLHAAFDLIAGHREAGRSVSMRPAAALVLPGLGSVVPGSLAAFRHDFDVNDVLNTVDLAAESLDNVRVMPSEVLLDPKAPSPEWLAKHQATIHHLAIYAQGVACGALMQSDGRFHPRVLVGHSMGEVSTLAVGGAISVIDGAALLIASDRVRTDCAIEAGGLLAVRLSAYETEKRIADVGLADLEVACLNSLAQTVVSGPRPALSEFADWLKGDGVGTRALPMRDIFHHSRLKAMAGRVLELAGVLTFVPPRHPVYSPCLRRYLRSSEDCRAAAISHLIRPVHFAETIARLRSLGIDTFWEAAPHSVVGPLVQAGAPDAVVSAPLREQAGRWVPRRYSQRHAVSNLPAAAT
jgi:acyl transferase domain-containing protein